MSTITFDTLKFAKTLKEAGVPEKQAEAQAEAMSDILEVNLKDLATKADVLALKESLQKDIQSMELRLTIKLGAFLAVAVGVMLTVLKMH
ncbi:MAG: DUF1640 domain-containing protein [Rhodoferax sp.]|nr:DUF1640 domain-containing protein [Rhodoferax sp.]